MLEEKSSNFELFGPTKGSILSCYPVNKHLAFRKQSVILVKNPDLSPISLFAIFIVNHSINFTLTTGS